MDINAKLNNAASGHDKKMIRLRQDGSCSYSLGTKTEISRSVHLSAEGLLYVGLSDGLGFNGMGVLFAGDSFLISNFQDSCPTGKALRLLTDELVEEQYLDRKRTSSCVIHSEVAVDYLREFCEINQIDEVNTVFDQDISWEDLVPSDYWIPSLTLSAANDFVTGHLGTTLVLLTPLADTPPKGVSEIVKGVLTKNKDIWYRRFERLINTTFPLSILSPVGLYRNDDKRYVVSLLPSGDFAEADETTDDMFDTIHTMVKSVQFIHSIGLTFNGSINPKCFTHMANGDTFLNAGHLISQCIDQSSLLGGYGGDDIRFMSSWRIRNLVSDPLRYASKFLRIDERAISLIEDDTISVGLLIAAMVNKQAIPFPWLSHSQYIVLSLVENTKGWNSLLCREPINFEAETPDLIQFTDLNPGNKLAHKLIQKEMSLAQVVEAIERFKQWRDQMDGTSVESEMKAVLSKVSSIFQTSQERFKESFGRYDLW